MLKFGFSSREYILLHENSIGDEDDEPDPLSLSDAELEEGGGVKGEVGAKGGQSASGERGGDSPLTSSEEEKKLKKKKKKKKSHKT